MTKRCWCLYLKKLFSLPVASALVMLAGIGSLTTAYIAEYAFGVQPCELCYWQRVPFGVAILLGGLGLFFEKREATLPLRRRPFHARKLLALSALTFLIGSGLAFFHTGVEQHWWNDLASCSIKPMKAEELAAIDVETLRNNLLATTGTPCDEITWSFLGLSMANWNVLYSLGLALFALLAATGRFAQEWPTRPGEQRTDGECCCRCSGQQSRPSDDP